MRPVEQNAGPAVNTVEIEAIRTRIPARPAFGMRASIPLPEPAPAQTREWIKPSTVAEFRASASAHFDALRADVADIGRAVQNWLREFWVYFVGLLKNAHASRAARAEVAAVAPVIPREGRETFVRLFAYAGGVGALAFVALHFLQPPPVAASIDPTPRPEWTSIPKPYPAFQLTLPNIGEEGGYAILRHADGGGRKDIITFGEAGRSLRYAMVEIYRPGQELDELASVPSEIAARARELGPAGEVRSTLPLETKFGSVSTVEFTFGRFGVGHCIGFMRAEAEPKLQISGLSCGMNQIMSRKSVACMLDRLTLISAGSDPDIAKYFAQAEIRRTFCGQRDPLLYATPKRDYPPNAAATVGLRGSAR